ncbi:Chloride channel protein ClC-Kb, partial [Charadrius vociferus]
GCLEWVKRQLFRVGEDWYFLFILGVLMATISFMMDLLVFRLYEAHRWLYQEVGDILVLKYLSWTMYPTALAAFSTGFSQSITPHSGGSGIPELKTILTGVVLEDYLAIQNFGAKVVGLTCTLMCGSTVFLGKVGPFVHLSALAAAYLGKMRTSVTREYEGGQGACVCLCLCPPGGGHSIFGVPTPKIAHSFLYPLPPETIAAVFKSDLKIDFPFDLLETFFFAILGAVCGLVGCAYLFCQRWLLAGGKENATSPPSSKPVYTVLVVLLLASITFPPGLGQLMASRLTMKEYLTSLFDNRTWGQLVLNASSVADLHGGGVDPRGLWQEWCHPSATIFGTLAFFLHAISTALLVCEATGHLGHVLPVVLAVLVANAITQKHQPSFYDGTIIVKKLPYLPPIRSRHMASYQVVVEEFMERRVVALAKADGFEEVLGALDASADAEYPVVESAGSATLVGTISRAQLVTFLQSHKHPQAPPGEKVNGGRGWTLGDSCAIEPIMLQLSPWTSLHQ